MREVYQLGPVFDSGIFHSDPMDGQGSSLFLYKSGLSILLPLTVPVPHYRYPTTGTHPSLEYRICHSAGKLSLFGKRSSVSDPYRIRFTLILSQPKIWKRILISCFGSGFGLFVPCLKLLTSKTAEF